MVDYFKQSKISYKLEMVKFLRGKYLKPFSDNCVANR